MSQPSHLSLKRDQQGRIAERSVRLGDSVETRRYAYDSAGRLVRVADGSGGLLESYQYDHEGLRLTDINPARFRGERRYSYRLGDRLGQAGSVQYGHDKAGFRNLKFEGDRETHYHYEPSGLLLRVDLPDGRRIEYAHDAKGLRTEKRANGRVVEAYRWLDPLRLSEFHDGREWWRLAYLEGRTPVGVTNGDDSYFLLCDQVVTPLALATTDGHVVQTMQYDSFGNLLQVRGDVVRLPIGFAGGLFDADTCLTRFPWRDYDADTGRFTALDPMGAKGGDSDWYGYCVDDPVNRVDAWGLFVFKERPLDSPFGSVPEISTPWLDKNNLELKHVQGWFEDGTGENIGKFSDGVHADKKHSEGDYNPRSESFPDDIAREALRRWPPENDSPYSCTSDNCQDWETQMRQRMYEIGREQRGSALDPR
ncbi:MAG: RHS repeat-associated core domain-containing protein [Humidesulfovibrio sp.]|uniref:RHS repeat domain-containing protein n=1 Tax=Humidesulfovibrio sp. TaxID=2910988 RepID=UPI0027EBF917|nr:RHS repeat-associated core domain-containing protein [Humidesulfovibrio sp.]MDQ7836571.1 RHS repeat-associated core domain-containing protein [Humidesulfovibrio sp.]